MNRRRMMRRRLPGFTGIDHEERALMSTSGAHPLFPAPIVAAEAHPVATAAHRAVPARHRGNAAPTSGRWGWLANTYRYVPPTNVPAVLLVSADPDAPLVVPVADQTAFHITGYLKGYFWGIAATRLGTSAPSYSSMLGSVTPEGKVLLLFQQMSGPSGPTITEGIGRVTPEFGRWTMENQMFTSPGIQSADGLQVGLWAYMVRTHPGLPSWNSLPSVGVSVPQFPAGSPGPGPHLVGS